MALTHSGISHTNRLNGLALVQFTGPEAANFLQGQLTQDMHDAGAGRTLLAACNTAQGRVIAVLRVRQIGTDVSALVAADVVDALVAHLKRYVLRAKVRIAADHGAAIIGRRGGNTGAATTDSATDAANDNTAIIFQ